jgi:hypothetical protein
MSDTQKQKELPLTHRSSPIVIMNIDTHSPSNHDRSILIEHKESIASSLKNYFTGFVAANDHNHEKKKIGRQIS